MKYLGIVLIATLISSCVMVPKENVDKEGIRKTIVKNSSVFKKCYEEALTRDKYILGKVKVEFDIIKGGVPTKAKTYENTTGDTKLAICVENKLMNLKFSEPPSGDILRVRYPFVFSKQ